MACSPALLQDYSYPGAMDEEIAAACSPLKFGSSASKTSLFLMSAGRGNTAMGACTNPNLSPLQLILVFLFFLLPRLPESPRKLEQGLGR